MFQVFGACLESMWMFERRTFYIGSLRFELILACQEVLRWERPPMNRCKIFFVQISTRTPSMHWKLTGYGKFCMQNKQLPTKSTVELKDNSIELQRWFCSQNATIDIDIVTTFNSNATTTPTLYISCYLWNGYKSCSSLQILQNLVILGSDNNRYHCHEIISNF